VARFFFFLNRQANPTQIRRNQLDAFPILILTVELQKSICAGACCCMLLINLALSPQKYSPMCLVNMKEFSVLIFPGVLPVF